MNLRYIWRRRANGFYEVVEIMSANNVLFPEVWLSGLETELAAKMLAYEKNLIAKQIYKFKGAHNEPDGTD